MMKNAKLELVEGKTKKGTDYHMIKITCGVFKVNVFISPTDFYYLSQNKVEK